MRRHGWIFLGTFVSSAIPVGALIYLRQPLAALLVGAVGLLVHWIASGRGTSSDGELADSSYFFGFLLTLVFLAVGLLRLGTAQDGAVGTSGAVFGFLQDLAAGLLLTILGLVIRQVRTLAAPAAQQPAPEQSLLEMQARLVNNMETLVALWRERPEQALIRDFHESRAAAVGAAQDLEKNVLAATERMRRSMDRLEETTSSVSGSLSRAASSAGDALSSAAERLNAELTHVVADVRGGVGGAVQQIRAEVGLALETLQQQRVEAASALEAARVANGEARTAADAHLREQLAAWTASLEQARAALAQAQQSLDDEYRRGLEGFAETGTAFAALAEQTAARVQALPDPAQRLAGLWDSVRELEAGLTGAVEGASREIGALRERAAALSAELERLGGSTRAAAVAVGAGGDALGDSLRRELEQMNGIIDEYVALLERTTRSLKAPAA